MGGNRVENEPSSAKKPSVWPSHRMDVVLAANDDKSRYLVLNKYLIADRNQSSVKNTFSGMG